MANRRKLHIGRDDTERSHSFALFLRELCEVVPQ
jgi:hypothetical protein